MTNKNYKVDKSYMNFIHARNFFPEGEAEEARNWLSTVGMQLTPNGFEIPNFNLVFPDLEIIIGEMLGDWVKIDDYNSGTFREPFDNQIMFEPFDSLNEWRLAVALHDNTFKTYIHKSGSKDARYGWEFDYKNPADWDVETILKIKTNDAVFYRPWVFHSFESKMIFHHKIYVQE